MNYIDWNYTRDEIIRNAPNVIIAILILVGAHFAAKGVKWAIAQGVARIPLPQSKNDGPSARPTTVIGERIGDVGYWIVWLLGLIVALTTLNIEGMTAILQPLNAMLDGFLRYVPQVVGGVLIFVIGFALATVARRLVEAAASAAEIDRRLVDAGLTATPRGPGLARLLGLLVFTLIIIPVSIQALDTLNIKAISDPATAMLNNILLTLPRVIGAALIILIAYLIGRWVALLTEEGLRGVGFDEIVTSLARAEPIRIGMDKMDPTPGVETVKLDAFPPSRMIGLAVLIGIVLFASVEASRLLGFNAMAAMLSQVLQLATQVLFGAIIIAIGVMLANILAAAVSKSDQPGGEIMSAFVRWGVIALSAAIGLRFMGLANDIILVAFALILGSVAVAAAIAFGIGGRDAAKKLLDRWSN